MQYHFNDTDAFAAFLAIWRAQLVGRTLTACFRPVATYESLPDHFDDGLVLCTTTIEMAIFVNTSGAQASFGRFPVNLDQPDHLLSRHHHHRRWEQWHDDRLIGQSLQTITLGFITAEGSQYTYCNQVVIGLTAHHLVLTDIQNMMLVQIDEGPSEIQQSHYQAVNSAWKQRS
ncbi:hypothetical protein [Kouleothrix sp.]|uniref:hypothetical protein n=1 Tax=Kouleothrix sp. TaxID=2779161 RepID=UPI00391DCBD2